MITGLDHVLVLFDDIGRRRQALLGRVPRQNNSGAGADRVLFRLGNMTFKLMAHAVSVCPIAGSET